MSTMDQMDDLDRVEVDDETMVVLELSLPEAEALHVWLLKPAADGTTSLDDPLVNGALAKLGRIVEAVRTTIFVRRELAQAGLNISHLTDDEVCELGRRISHAAMPSTRS